MTYEIGTEDHSIKWTVINTAPLLLPFNILREGISVKTGRLFNYVNEITIDVDGFDVGTYGFIIEVEDKFGGIFTDVVWVTVKNSKPVFTSTPNDFSYEVGETGNNLSWTFSDVSTINPTYTITRNGLPLIIDNPCTSGEPIVISVDGLSVGTYGFIIEVNDGYDGTVLDSVWVAVIPSSDSNFINLIYIDIIDQSFSTEDFNVTFAVYNESSQGIDTATIQMWWNGNDVSDSVINLGNGLYFVSLEPITVVPGEDPILLKMIISASGYEDKQFETYLAVDPDTLEKGVGNGVEGVPLVTIIIAIISTVAGIAVATATIVLLRKRKRASEGI